MLNFSKRGLLLVVGLKAVGMAFMFGLAQATQKMPD
jgi:hypothetical protein